MKLPPLAFCLLALVLIGGCASTDDPGPVEPPQLSFAQVKADPQLYKGQPVTLAGEVLSARRLKEGTRIELLQLPLASSLQPALDRRQSQGRFVAVQREFLDPATIPTGTLVTLSGDLAGSVTLPLDETEYEYPLVEIRNLRVWTAQETAPQLRPYPYMGPGPYWRRPLWSPYGTAWPYW
ncbi:MAG: Slp family lipoprotein [Nitrospiraceae bacterium]|nr:Slp family lipoprotein [Nitrospiraceae bacterium]